MVKKIYFTHIPKTAGTTIEDIAYKTYSKNGKKDTKYLIGYGYFQKFLLNDNNSENPKDVYEYYLKKKYYDILFEKSGEGENHKRPWFFHIPISFWKNNLIINLKKKFKVFCVVRNPYDRYVSDFKFWIDYYKKEEKLNNKYRKDMVKFLKIVYENNFDVTTENLNRMVKKLFSTEKYKYSFDCHLVQQYKYIYTVIDKKVLRISDIVLRFEYLNYDFNKFKRKYLPLIPDNSLEDNHLLKTTKTLTKDDLTKESKELIYNYYKKDFKLLGYKK